MKKLLYLTLTLSVFCYCKKENDENFNFLKKETPKLDSSSTRGPNNLPLGEKKLIEYDFPKKWENLNGIDDTNPDFTLEKISKKGYDSLFYFLEKHSNKIYNDFNKADKISISLPQKKALYLLNLYDKSVVLDAMHKVEVLKKTKNYTVDIYKNDNKFDSLLTAGNEKNSFNYLCLVTTDKQHKPIDYLLIYYNNINDFLSYKRFFYIDENCKIYLKDFIVNELDTEMLDKYFVEINDQGFFNKK